MKYKEGDIVLLKNGKTVYIVSVDKKAQTYLVTDTDEPGTNAKSNYIKESSIQMLVT